MIVPSERTTRWPFSTTASFASEMAAIFSAASNVILPAALLLLPGLATEMVACFSAEVGASVLLPGFLLPPGLAAEACRGRAGSAGYKGDAHGGFSRVTEWTRRAGPDGI
jgi:hypothetical protein